HERSLLPTAFSNRIYGVPIKATMSAMGQKRTWLDQIAMSALPPKADIAGQQFDVRLVPKADIRRLFDHLVEGRHRGRSPGLRHSTRFAG
ncbi:MAG: hypothetical protein WCD52_16710, partial [Xanthobacteraceae bacterium]